MEKNTIFSKLNIKDYNNELEKILDKKVFSIDTKNLLLSMLYKIENAYSDYLEVKREVPNKNTYIENIVNTIENECKEIEIFKSSSEKGKKIKESDCKYVIDKKNKKISSLDNENVLLEAIIKINKSNIVIPENYDFLDSAYKYVLSLGYAISDTEVINDFNGWSWDISKHSEEKANCNLIYQTLLYTIGNTTLYEFIDNNNVTTDYIKIVNNEIINKYGKTIGEEFKKRLYICLLYLYVKKNPDIKEKVLLKIEEYKNKLEKMEDKERYVCELTFKKIKCSKFVEELDKALNDYEQLKKKYDGLSKEEKEKVLSISDYETKLEKERENKLQEIKNINNMIRPKEYIKTKENLQNRIETYKSAIETDGNELMISLCKIFLKGFIKTIEKTDSKKELIELIYKLRYYRFIQFNNKNLKDIEELNEDFKYAMKLLIGRSCNLKVLEVISEDFKINYMILKIIFDTKIINLKDINFECKTKNDTLVLQYFDSKMFETTVEIKIDDSTKIKKKANLFIH